MSEERTLQREAPGPFYRPYWGEPRYLLDGDTVWLPIGTDVQTGKTRVYRCTVAVAAGDHARIVSAAKGIDRWARLNTLLVPPEDPRHWNNA